MKYVMHLDASTYEGLLRGDLPPDVARALARHLEGECEPCEAFLSSLPSSDAVDGRVDAALCALAPDGARGNDLEFARVERRLRAGATTTRRPRRVAAWAVAAVLLVAGVVGLVARQSEVERPAWDGLKGTSRAIPVRLRFLVLAPGPDGALAMEKGVSGQAVSPSASLQFEIETGRAAGVALVRIPVRGPPEVVWSERVREGRTPVSVGGHPAAYPLSDLSGPQRFVLVASEEELTEARLLAAAAALAPPARASSDLPALDGLSLDVVEVDVR